MRRCFFVLAVMVALALPAHAQVVNQFEIGKRAYDARKFETAFKILLPLAERDHARAQLMIGDMYNTGKGVERDNASAISWYRKSAELGNPEAVQMLGQGMRLFGESSGD